MLPVRISLPNSAHLQNLQGFLKKCAYNNPTRLDFSMHDRWVSVHPAVLAMTACAAAAVRHSNGTVDGNAEQIGALPYLIRMKLFDYLGLDPKKAIQEHEAAGRFIPLTQIRTSHDLSAAVTDLVPLLHAQPREADAIRYVFSELARNALEHSDSPVGAFICAQYYKQTKRISIGIADAGIGIRASITKSHRAKTVQDAITLALQPGITGTTARLGGTESNAGAGLFFVKSIAALSRNFFVLYSEDTLFKLLKGNQSKPVVLHADPRRDNHLFGDRLPEWRGTVVGVDISMAAGQQFTNFLAAIRHAYAGGTTNKNRKDYFKRIRFAK
jgi:anti-sigma regulatory factor (Ser/Thr protein kinase)